MTNGSAIRPSIKMILPALAVAALTLGGCRNAKRDHADATAAADPVASETTPDQSTKPLTRPSSHEPRLTRTQRADASVMSGRTHQTAGDHAAALAAFERAIAVNPTLTIAYLGAGDMNTQLGNYTAAEGQFQAAARLEPRNFDAQYGHAFVLQLLSRFTEAVRAYLRALAIQPNDFNANLHLATTYMELAEPEQALAYAQRAVDAGPDSGEARMNLGAVYAEVERDDLAVIEYQQAAELLTEPDPRLLLNLAESFNRLERYAEMVATLDQVILVEPSATAYERRGSGYFRLKDYDASLNAFRDALGIDGSYYPALNGVAVCQLNRYLWSSRTDTIALDEAADALRRSLQINRDQPQIVELLRRYGPSSSP